MEHEGTPTPSKRPRRKGRRLVRWVVRLLVGVPLLAALGLVLVLRTPLLDAIVRSQVQSMTGCELQASSITLNLDGRLVVQDFELVAPNIDGPAAHLISADRLDLDLDLMGVFSGGIRPTGVWLYRPIIRISQSTRSGELNVAKVNVQSDPSGSAGMGGGLPRIDTVEGTLQLAEHSPPSDEADGDKNQPRYRVLREFSVDGALTPIEPGKPVYGVRLHELTGAPIPVFAPQLEESAATGPDVDTGADSTPPPTHIAGPSVGLMTLEGRIDLADGSASLRLRNLALGALTRDSIPTLYHDVWAGLDIRGRVSDAEFIYDRQGGARVSVTLDGVSMQTPIPAEDDADPDGTVSLREVSGVISLSRNGLNARLSALVENQTVPSTVVFSTEGLDLDAAARCEIISQRVDMAEHYDLLPYAPRMVRKYIKRFANPTGLADTRVVVERGRQDAATGEPGKLSVRGTLIFREIKAAFEKFPYPFHSIRGHVEFTDSSIDIIDVQGIGQSGARLTARGRITPLDPDAQVDLDILVLDAPTDEALLTAMPTGKRPIIDVLFSKPRLQELVDAGLVRDATNDAGQLPGADAQANGAQPFRLGGTAQVSIQVHRDLGPADVWKTTISVRFPEVGFVPEPFPFPLIGKDVEIVVTDDDARLTSGTFTGFSGGTVALEAAASLAGPDGKADLRPALRVLAKDIPVDDYLLHAVARMETKKQPNAARKHNELSAAEVLTRLDIDGTVNCDARVTASETEFDDDGERKTIYDAAISFAGMSAAPEPFRLDTPQVTDDERSPRLQIDDLAGDLRVTPEFLRINTLTGRLRHAGADAADDVDAVPESIFSLTCEMLTPQAEGAARSLAAHARVTSLDVTLPVEDVLGVVSAGEEGGAAAIAELRARRTPTGIIDLDAEARMTNMGDAAGTVNLKARISTPRDLEASVLGGRLRVPTATGSLTVHAGADRRVSFDEFAADVLYNGVPACRLVASGGVGLAGDTLRPIGPADLTLSAWGVTLESPVVPAMIGAVLGEDAAAGLARQRLRGVVDLDLSATTPKLTDKLAAVDESIAQTPPVDVSLSVSPSSLTIAREMRNADDAAPADAVDVALTPITGRVTLSGRVMPELSPTWNLEIDRLRANTPNWSVSADGRGTIGLDRAVTLDMIVSASGRAVDRPMLALMPGDVRAIVEDLQPTFEHAAEDSSPAFVLSPTPIRLSLGPQPIENTAQTTPAGSRLRSLTLDSELVLRDVSFAVGAPVRNADANVRVRVRAGADLDSAPIENVPSADGSYTAAAVRGTEVELFMPRAEIGGISITDARALVVVESSRSSGDRAQHGGVDVLVPYLWANCHAGRLLASATLHTPTNPSEKGWYKADMMLAGVQLAPILADVRQAAELNKPGDADGPPSPSAPDASRGLVDAWVSVAGSVGDPTSRYGRGSIRIADGDVLRLPVIYSLMQISNFQLPSSDRLDYLQTSFEIEGPVMRFPRIAVLSRTLAIVGMGSITLPDLRITMLFNSKSASRIPLVSDVVEAVRDELISTVVTGTLRDPDVSTRSFLGIRRAFGSIFDPMEPAAVLDSTATEDAARAERDRVSSPGRQ